MKISTLLFLCALSLSSVAAYYSIIGLATIFSASFYAVVLMAAVLEVSKLVCASWLYQKWDKINSLIKTYLTTAVIVLMLITSLGIFGFLSRAHVDQRLGNTEVTLKIEQIDAQIASIKEVMERYRAQLSQLDRAINIQLDANRATQALAARTRQVAERDQIRQKLDSEQQNLQKLEQAKMELKQKSNVLESEVGPIKYIAEFFVQNEKVDVEKAVRWMIVVIVLVFDPLAVLMLIAANMSMIREEKVNTIKDQLPTLEIKPTATIDTAQDHLSGKIALRYDFQQRTLMYFDGEKWIPTELGLVKQTVPNLDLQTVSSVIDTTVQNAVNKYLSEHQQSQLDLSKIKLEVKNAMDAWLTTATTDLHSKTDKEPILNDIANTQQATIEEVKVTVIPVTSNTKIENNIAITETNIQPDPLKQLLEKPTSWI